MCAYKLCKVEFRYWGMQSKIERFIHDVGRCSVAEGVCVFIILYICIYTVDNLERSGIILKSKH